jgi:hypothetical protein
LGELSQHLRRVLVVNNWNHADSERPFRIVGITEKLSDWGWNDVCCWHWPVCRVFSIAIGHKYH